MSTGDGDHVPDCDEPLCAGCTLADDYALLEGAGTGVPVGFLAEPTARETHQPWFCSECAAFRCSAWTPDGGGRCCWCGVFLAMP